MRTICGRDGAIDVIQLLTPLQPPSYSFILQLRSLSMIDALTNIHVLPNPYLKRIAQLKLDKCLLPKKFRKNRAKQIMNITMKIRSLPHCQSFNIHGADSSFILRTPRQHVLYILLPRVIYPACIITCTAFLGIKVPCTIIDIQPVHPTSCMNGRSQHRAKDVTNGLLISASLLSHRLRAQASPCLQQLCA
ncbi:hypothetical protein D3C81_1525650 [compost metagenome]